MFNAIFEWIIDIASLPYAIVTIIWGFIKFFFQSIFDPVALAHFGRALALAMLNLAKFLLPDTIDAYITEIQTFLSSPEVAALFRVAYWCLLQIFPAALLGILQGAIILTICYSIMTAATLKAYHQFWGSD